MEQCCHKCTRHLKTNQHRHADRYTLLFFHIKNSGKAPWIIQYALTVKLLWIPTSQTQATSLLFGSANMSRLAYCSILWIYCFIIWTLVNKTDPFCGPVQMCTGRRTLVVTQITHLTIQYSRLEMKNFTKDKSIFCHETHKFKLSEVKLNVVVDRLLKGSS